jgi:hypothetical protein
MADDLARTREMDHTTDLVFRPVASLCVFAAFSSKKKTRFLRASVYGARPALALGVAERHKTLVGVRP